MHASRLRVIVGALIAAFALSGAAVANASAATFLASEAGLALKLVKNATQKFKTSAGTIECKELTVKGTTTAKESETQKAEVKYKECVGYGIPLTVSVADYDFHSNGEVEVEKEIKVKGEECEVKVPVQTVKTVSYKTVEEAGKKDIELVPAVKGIKSSGEGNKCKYAAEEAGEYTGTSVVEAEGGSLEFP